jgi:hypothetical protein
VATQMHALGNEFHFESMSQAFVDTPLLVLKR